MRLPSFAPDSAKSRHCALRFLPSLLLAALTLVLATACAGYEERITIDRNGSGRYEVRATMDADLVNLGEADFDPVTSRADDLSERWAGLASGDISVTPANERVNGKGYYGLRFSVPFGDVDGLARLIGAIAAENEGVTPADAATWPPPPVLKLVQQGDTVVLTGSIAPVLVVPSPGEAPVLAGQLVAAQAAWAAGQDATVPPLDDDTRDTLHSMHRTLVLTLPGQVLAANADSRAGNNYTWTIDLLDLSPKDIQATWKPNGNPALSANPHASPATPTSSAGR